ncbi:MAG: ACT domain-containing protein [Verrucomicrobiota bacterium]
MEASAKTAEKTGPRVKQFSIFLPNKVGALSDVVKVLHEHNVHVLAMNVQDSADSAIVRIVVSDPEQVQDLLGIHDIPYSACDVVVVEMREGATELAKLLTALLMAEVNIHGSYGLLTRPNGNCALALHVEDNDCASAVLRSHGFRILSQMDISR